MQQIRYIHAADLHLDTPFQGIGRNVGGSLSRHLQQATFTALERLGRLCENEHPDFLLLAGDIYNAETHSIKAQLAVSDLCRQLQPLGIRIFLVHGNHDPLDTRFKSINWPENVTIFGPEMEIAHVKRDGITIALIHGISHSQPKEMRNLAKLFSRNGNGNCFELGLLHCSVEGQANDRYAPCSLQDLRDTGLDAFALGHVHTHSILCDSPFIAYSGNTQGLHINEAGPRGCHVVTVTPRNGHFVCEAEFRPLGPVVFASETVDLDGVEHLDVLEERICMQLDKLGASAWSGCQALVVRLVLEGATPLDSLLHSGDGQADLLERLASLQSASPGIWVKDFRIRTTPPIDWEEYRRRDDLLGSALRMVQELREKPEKLHSFADPLLQQMYAHSRLRHILQKPDEHELHDLLDDAERLCVALLEMDDVH